MRLRVARQGNISEAAGLRRGAGCEAGPFAGVCGYARKRHSATDQAYVVGLLTFAGERRRSEGSRHQPRDV